MRLSSLLDFGNDISNHFERLARLGVQEHILNANVIGRRGKIATAPLQLFQKDCVVTIDMYAPEFCPIRLNYQPSKARMRLPFHHVDSHATIQR